MRLMHCVQEFLDFLVAHSNPENRVSSKGDAQKDFAQYVFERHESPSENSCECVRVARHSPNVLI
jgi:hypothetical protein